MITLKSLGNTYDITSITNTDISTTLSLTGDFANGKILMPNVKNDYFNDLDLSKRIPNLSIIEIDKNGKKTQWYISNDDVTKVDDTHTRHEIDLIELKWIMSRKPIPDISYTQTTTNENEVKITEIEKMTPRQLWLSIEMPIFLTTNIASNDTNIIQNRVLKGNRTFNIDYNIQVSQREFGLFSGDVTVKIKILIGGVVVRERSAVVKPMPSLFSNKTVVTIKDAFSYNNTGTNEVTILADTEFFYAGNGIYVDSGDLTITNSTTVIAETLYLDGYVEKILKLFNASDSYSKRWNQTNELAYKSAVNKGTLTSLDDVNTHPAGYVARIKTREEDYYEWQSTTNISTVRGNVSKGTRCYLVGDIQNDKLSFTSGSYEILECVDTGTTIDIYDYFIVEAYNNNLVLDADSKARLSQIKSRDFMIEGYDMLMALEEVASYAKANLSIYIENDIKCVKFDFYEDMARITYEELPKLTNKQTRNITDYQSGVVLNNDNIIKDSVSYYPFKNGWATLRANDNNPNQITQTNLGLLLPQHEKITKVLIKGISIPYAGGTVPANTVRDITSQVKEKYQYDVLSKLSNYTKAGRLNNDNQNNCIYYERGGSELFGLNNTGTQEQSLFPTLSNRALYEVVATIDQRNNPSFNISTHVDGKTLDQDNAIEIYVEYISRSTSNAIVLKDDQTGFEEKPIRYLGANARINDAVLLGNHARTTVNGKGGTIETVSGYYDGATTNQLGCMRGNNRLVSITEQYVGDKVYYIHTFIKDHVFISPYVGQNQEHRNTEVSLNNYVRRIDRSHSVIYLDLENKVGNDTPFSNLVDFVNFGNGRTAQPPTLALLDFDDIKITTTVESMAIANTISWVWLMQDNYSAGMSKFKDGTKWFQQGVPYCDVVGRVSNLKSRYYKEGTMINQSEYPRGHITTSGLVATVEYQVAKDSREMLGLNTEISILSHSDSILVYNGIGTYNPMARHDNRDIRLAVLQYKPTRDDFFIDMGRITPTPNGTTVTSDYIDVTLNGVGDGFAWYDFETKELIIAVITPVNNNTKRIYVKGEVYE